MPESTAFCQPFRLSGVVMGIVFLLAVVCRCGIQLCDTDVENGGTVCALLCASGLLPNLSCAGECHCGGDFGLLRV